MDRLVKYRGKLLNNETKHMTADGWIYGGCFIRDADDVSEGGSYIISKSLEHIGNANAVAPESVGQFSGLFDKNGNEIYEGDILSGMFLFSMPIEGIVTFRDGAFGLMIHRGEVDDFTAFTSMCNIELEVVGNVFDHNAEVLNETYKESGN